MAWPESTRASWAADQACTLAGAQSLEARDHHLYAQMVEMPFASNNTTSATDVTLATLTLWVPAWAAAGLCTFTLTVLGLVTGGTGTWHIDDSTDSVTGADTTVTTTGTAADTTATVVLTADNPRVNHTILVKGKVTGGETFTLANVTGVTGRWVE